MHYWYWFVKRANEWGAKNVYLTTDSINVHKLIVNCEWPD